MSADFIEWLMDSQGHLDAKPIDRDRFAAITLKLFAQADIITGTIGDFDFTQDAWCYHSYAAAKQALDAWDGSGEPEGWFRNPKTGRRLAEGPGCFDEDGRAVPKGEMYVRW